MNSEKVNVIVGLVVAAVVIGALVLVFFGRSSAPAEQPAEDLGGQRAGLQEYVDGIKPGDINTKWVAKTLPPGAVSVPLYTNNTGQDVYATFGSVDIPTGQTASTTQAVSLFATSSSATSVPTWADFAAPTEGKRALINDLALATSTTASSTNSVLAAAGGVGAGSILVPNGSTLFGFMRQTFGTLCTGSVCETASSTNRGFNPKFKVLLTTYGLSF